MSRKTPCRCGRALLSLNEVLLFVPVVFRLNRVTVSNYMHHSHARCALAWLF